MVHYHVLLDAEFVDINSAREAWGKHVPKDYVRESDDKSPAFGHVRFSKGDFKNMTHAARYASKYLLKVPEYGWPDWVLNSKKRVVRYTTSRGFWPQEEEPTDDKVPDSWEPKIHEGLGECEPDCFCRLCREAIDEPEVETTVNDRIQNCRTKTALIKETEILYSDGTLRTQVEYIESYEASPIKIAQALSVELQNEKHFYLDRWQLGSLAEAGFRKEINSEDKQAYERNRPPDDL